MKRSVIFASLALTSVSVFGMESTNPNSRKRNFDQLTEVQLKELSKEELVDELVNLKRQLRVQKRLVTQYKNTSEKFKNLNSQFIRYAEKKDEQITDLIEKQHNLEENNKKLFRQIKSNDHELNFINLQKDKIETLKIKIEDLRYADLFDFPNLKELVISILIGSKKPNNTEIDAKTTEKKIPNYSKVGTIVAGKLKQWSIEDAFSPKNREKLRDKWIRKEIQRAEEKMVIEQKSTKQWITRQLSVLLAKTPNLESLYFGYSFIENLPSKIWNLEKLKSLTLKMLRITEISPTIENLTNLEILDLSNNKISQLPETISNLKNLRELNLIGNNFLETFPEVITRMPYLKILKIDQTQKERWNEALQKLSKNLEIEVW